MKKIITIILSLLLVFSFTSCSKDKSEEVITSYQGFWEAYSRWYTLSTLFDSDEIEKKKSSSDNTFDITLNKQEIIEMASLEEYWDDYINTLSEKDPQISINDSKVGGTISGTYTDDYNYTINMNDVSIPYTIKDSTNTTVLETGTLKLSGSMSVMKNSDNSRTFKYDFKANDYSCSSDFTLKNGKYLSASYNGKNIDLRLLNSVDYGS